MQSDLSVIEGAYLRDIRDQPRALEETLTAARAAGARFVTLREYSSA